MFCKNIYKHEDVIYSHGHSTVVEFVYMVLSRY